MKRQELEKVAVRYPYLRGLLAIPLGMLWIATGLSNLEWGPFSQIWTFWVFAFLAAGAYFGIVRFYETNYGRVVPRKSQLRGAVEVGLSLVVLIGGPMLVGKLDPPFNGVSPRRGVWLQSLSSGRLPA